MRHGRTVIEDVGTSFDAYATERETRVAVLQGRVNVYDSPEFLAEAPQHSSSSGPNTPVSLDTVPLSLDAGMQAHIPDDLNARDKQTVSTLDPHEIARLNDWQHGEIPLDGLSLLESTREFSRYNRVRFVIADPEIGELQPAGIFTATHVDGYLGFLQDKFWIVATSAVDDQGMRVITPDTQTVVIARSTTEALKNGSKSRPFFPRGRAGAPAGLHLRSTAGFFNTR